MGLELGGIAGANFEIEFILVLLELPFEIGFEGLEFPFQVAVLNLHVHSSLQFGFQMPFTNSL